MNKQIIDDAIKALFNREKKCGLHLKGVLIRLSKRFAWKK